MPNRLADRPSIADVVLAALYIGLNIHGRRSLAEKAEPFIKPRLGREIRRSSSREGFVRPLRNRKGTGFSGEKRTLKPNPRHPRAGGAIATI